MPPEQLRAARDAIMGALENAGAVAGQYLSTHQNIATPGVFQGLTSTSSTNTAMIVESDLQRALRHGLFLAGALGKSATYVEANESDSAAKVREVLNGPDPSLM
ncbi:hypothetical protein CQY22_010280 [Mycolicibacterium brumae]|uniref:Uncharacterized protein n=1 Tax=Mycolicibacterium brumae TaxID=85968 RepID=A0A2G5PAZ8_9MYCO|nr:hypothetical protein CQY22_010280 [Mycolicibacterium brumae]